MAKKMYRKKSSKKPKKAFKKRKSSSIKKLVRMEVARNIENKSAQCENLQQVLYGSDDTNFANNVITLGPSPIMSIQQGSSNGSRVGTQIKTKKLTIKGTLVPTQWNTTTNTNPAPVQVKMWVIYDRINPDTIPQVQSNFFQSNNANQAFRNDLTDMWAQVNTDRYRVLATKTFKLGFAAYTGTASTAANQLNWQAYTSNDFKLNCNFSFDLTKHYPKFVKFDENGSTPMTRGLYLLVQPVYAAGIPIPNGTYTAAIQWAQNYVYEDA